MFFGVTNQVWQSIWNITLDMMQYRAMARNTMQYEGLAVDGDPNTCSFTSREESPRWWQVMLNMMMVMVNMMMVIVHLMMVMVNDVCVWSGIVA